jgi:hypothetical protein
MTYILCCRCGFCTNLTEQNEVAWDSGTLLCAYTFLDHRGNRRQCRHLLTDSRGNTCCSLFVGKGDYQDR